MISIQPSRSQCSGITAAHLELGTLDEDTERKEQRDLHGLGLGLWQVGVRKGRAAMAMHVTCLPSFRIITCVVDAARELMGGKYLPTYLEVVVEENHGTKVVLVPTLVLRGK